MIGFNGVESVLLALLGVGQRLIDRLIFFALARGTAEDDDVIGHIIGHHGTETSLGM